MDYTAPEKVDGTSTWSAEEHNQMKAALNSKMDKANLRTSLESASDSTYPSTLAVANLFNVTVMHRGSVNAATNLNTLTQPGFWIAADPPTSGTWHASFPSDMPDMLVKVGVFNYAKGEFIVQELTLCLTDPRVFKRVCTGAPESAGWSNWVEYTTVSRADATYAPRVISGIPSFYLSSAGPAWELDIIESSRDLGGKFQLIHLENSQTIESVNFTCQFEHPRQNILAILLTPASDQASNASWQIDTFSSTGFTGKIKLQLNAGDFAAFFYSVITNS